MRCATKPESARDFTEVLPAPITILLPEPILLPPRSPSHLYPPLTPSSLKLPPIAPNPPSPHQSASLLPPRSTLLLHCKTNNGAVISARSQNTSASTSSPLQHTPNIEKSPIAVSQPLSSGVCSYEPQLRSPASSLLPKLPPTTSILPPLYQSAPAQQCSYAVTDSSSPDFDHSIYPKSESH